VPPRSDGPLTRRQIKDADSLPARPAAGAGGQHQSGRLFARVKLSVGRR